MQSFLLLGLPGCVFQSLELWENVTEVSSVPSRSFHKVRTTTYLQLGFRKAWFAYQSNSVQSASLIHERRGGGTEKLRDLLVSTEVMKFQKRKQPELTMSSYTPFPLYSRRTNVFTQKKSLFSAVFFFSRGLIWNS